MNLKKNIILCSLAIMSLVAYAQESPKSEELIPNNSIFITAGAVYDNGFETTIGTEHFFNNNRIASMYFSAGYLSTREKWDNEAVECKKFTAEIGGRCYIPAIKNKLYPYVGLGITGGIQGLRQSSYIIQKDVIDENSDPYLFGGACTIGLEYLVSHNVAIEIHGRAKYYLGDRYNFVIGGGLKFFF